MKMSVLSKQNLGHSYACSRTNHHVCMEQPQGMVHKGGESHCTLPAAQSISTSLVAAIVAIIIIPWPPPVCITRRRWGLKHPCSPHTLPTFVVHQMQLNQLHQRSLHQAKRKPDLSAKVQNKASHRLQDDCTVKYATAQWCNSPGRRTNLVSKALAFPLDPWPWWACS